MKRTRLLLCAATMIVTLSAHAQKDDVGLWVGAGVEKKLSDKWEVGFGAEYRMCEELSASDRISMSADATYKINDWMKATVGYIYLHGREPKRVSDGGKYIYSSYWYPRHRTHAGITLSKKFGRFKVSLRERWMYTYRPSFERDRMNIVEGDADYGKISHNDKSGKGEHVLRSRLNVQYDIKKCKFTPYASVESFNQWAVDKMRYSVGTEYKLNKKNAVKVFYLFEDMNQRTGGDPVQDKHVFGIKYSLSL